MAKNEPNKPEEAKTAPAQETTAGEKSTPAPMPEIGGEAPALEKTAEETAALPHENGATPDKTDTDRPEEPILIGIPVPGDVVVSFDKINGFIPTLYFHSRGIGVVAQCDYIFVGIAADLRNGWRGSCFYVAIVLSAEVSVCSFDGWIYASDVDSRIKFCFSTGKRTYESVVFFRFFIVFLITTV